MRMLILKKSVKMTTISFLTTCFVALAGLTSGKVDLDKGTGAVEFRAIGRPSSLKVIGKGPPAKGNFTVKDRDVSGKAHFKLSDLDTGIGLRNKHMKEKYLEVEKYPEATLTLSQLKLPKDLVGNTTIDEVPFEGKLKLHGVEKTVKGTAEIRKNADQVSVQSKFGFKLSDYGIDVPKYAGITVADEVQVSVQNTAPFVTSAPLAP
jgi:polyisoprenoid-binding protein YceI